MITGMCTFALFTSHSTEDRLLVRLPVILQRGQIGGSVIWGDALHQL